MPTDFRSPRFSGDAVLEEILRDPDTGTKKLGPGSPEAESIKKVQQALFDLMWTQRIDTPVSDPSQFVIGIFGPITSKTALAYKQHYDIHFPPDAPSGFIDHFVGPRTLDLLDEQCVLFDECDPEKPNPGPPHTNRVGGSLGSLGGSMSGLLRI